LIIPRLEPVRVETPRRLRRFGRLKLAFRFGPAVDDPVFGRAFGGLPSCGGFSGGSEVARRTHAVPRTAAPPSRNTRCYIFNPQQINWYFNILLTSKMPLRLQWANTLFVERSTTTGFCAALSPIMIVYC
jgi:hypothetical protein